jgi:hypothetical protein
VSARRRVPTTTALSASWAVGPGSAAGLAVLVAGTVPPTFGVYDFAGKHGVSK